MIAAGWTAVMLAVAGWGKRDQTAFSEVIGEFRLLPRSLVGPAAYALPRVEIAIAALLTLMPALPLSRIAAAALLLTFTIAMGVNLLRGRRRLDCGCGWGEKRTISWSLVASNATLAIVLLLTASDLPPAGPAAFAAGALLAILASAWRTLAEARR